MIQITKVVTKNFIQDFIAQIQNALGMNLKSYESMVEKGFDQIKKELKEKKIKLKWYRYEITQLTNGAIVIYIKGFVIQNENSLHIFKQNKKI